MMMNLSGVISEAGGWGLGAGVFASAVLVFGAAFLAGVFVVVAFLAGAFLTAVFAAGAFLAGVFLAGMEEISSNKQPKAAREVERFRAAFKK
jgi:hypothetical protein